MKIFLYIVFFFCSSIIIAAQTDTVNKILYTSNYQFKDGIFLNLEQLKLNKPIPAVRLITQVNLEDPDFFKEITKFDKIYYFDDYGIKQEILTNNIWGYCKNNALYINYSEDFNRVTIIGSVCNFVAYTKVYRNSFNDPFNDYNSMGYMNYQSTELREYLFDFESGKIMDLSVENVAIIIKKNKMLYDEFNSLKKRNKRQLMYYYLRKYNEATPLYLEVVTK